MAAARAQIPTCLSAATLISPEQDAVTQRSDVPLVRKRTPKIPFVELEKPAVQKDMAPWARAFPQAPYAAYIWHIARTKRDQADRFCIHPENCSRYVLLCLKSCLISLLILMRSLTMGGPSLNAWYQHTISNTSLMKFSSSRRLVRGMVHWPWTSLTLSGARIQRSTSVPTTSWRLVVV